MKKYLILFSILALYSCNTKKLVKEEVTPNCSYKTFYENNYSVGDKVLIPEIQRGFHKPWVINTMSDSLKPVSEFLLRYPNYIVELRSHTDFRDTEKRNLELTQKLAEEYVDYLITKGHYPKTIIAKGMGESEPLVIDYCIHNKYAKFAIGDTLNYSYIMAIESNKERELAHKLNRRNEIVIVNILEE